MREWQKLEEDLGRQIGNARRRSKDGNDFQKGKWYWLDATVDGIRYRVPLKTTNWQEAKNKEKENLRAAAEGRLNQKSDRFARLGFSEAAQEFLKSRKIELSESSYKKEKQLLVQPVRYFRSLPLRRLETQHLLEYREQRATTVGTVIVNMEIGVIARILKKAKRWNLVGSEIKPLKNRTDEMGQAMEVVAKAKLLEIAASRPEWANTRCAAILALNTTMRACEIRSLRWRNVNFIDRRVRIEKSKTEKGKRTIPLNRLAFDALIELYHRARSLEAADLEHYVFPSCEHGHFDPTKPQKTWRTSWRKLTKEAGLKGLRFHDLRHHAITELAESQQAIRPFSRLPDICPDACWTTTHTFG